MSKLFTVKLDYDRKIALKSGDPGALFVEAMVTRKAYELSCRHKIFRTPKVISFDPARGVLELELIENIEALKSLLPGNPKLGSLLAMAAESLVLVHEELRLDKEEMIRVPEVLSCAQCGESAIHGDFTLRNVQYDLSNNMLVIIDWSFAPGFQKVANYGPGYLDLASMVNSIFSSPPYSFFSRGSDRAELAQVFINRYFELCGPRADFKLFASYLHRISEMFFRNARNRTPWHRFQRQKQNRKKFVRFADLLQCQ
jgi:hypothetical protein